MFGGTDGRWLGYATCKAAWANEPVFADKKRHGELSLVEERACVMSQVMASYNLAGARLQERATGNDEAAGEQGEAAVIAAMPELERHILLVYRQGLLDGYILYEVMGRSCPLAVAMMDETVLAQLREYVRTHVVPAL